MTQIVYADVLFVTNMLITYLLLSLVSSVFKVKGRVWRMIAASALGGIFSFYILAPEQNLLITMLIKFSFSVAIIFCAFKSQSARRFFRLLLGFYVVSFGFAGVMIAVWIIVKPDGMVINNSTVYFNISVPLLLASCAVCYGVIWIAQRVISKRVPQNSVCDVTIVVESVRVTCRAIIDTGNNLVDLFSGYPVIIAEYRSVERLIPTDFRQFYCGNGEMPQSAGDFGGRVRATPYEAVGGGGILPAFRPDYITLKNGGKLIKIDNVIVAVTVNNLPQSDYQVLLNCAMSGYLV